MAASTCIRLKHSKNIATKKTKLDAKDPFTRPIFKALFYKRCDSDLGITLV